MADVKKYTNQIAKAQKGRDVRDAIVNAINEVSDENNEYNQVKADILSAQSDIAEKVIKNEQTAQTFAVDVKKAEELKQGLDTDITHGTALKSQLDTAVETADTSKKNLDASNTTATKTKADLDASNTTASEAKTGLDATNKTAADLVASLGDKITEGTQVKTDIQTTGETAMSSLQAEAAKQQEYIKTSIDDTLSISGKAADAAVTGKKIDSLKEDISNKITKFYASNQGEAHITDSDNGKIQDMMIYGKSSQDETPTLENPVEIKSVVNPTVKVTNEDNVNVQSFTVNDVTLCAVPVKEGGNITVNNQQYIADYIDVENGKIVKCVKKLFLKPYQWSKAINKGVVRFYASTIDAVGIDGNKIIKNTFSISSHFAFVVSTPDRIGTFTVNSDGTYANMGFAFSTDTTITSGDFNNWILNNKPFVFLAALKEELPLTSEQILALKKLSTYYPVTNISINSEQLDGYTVFNYPISMENGWNYVKQQIGDTRDYIYDMDARTQDTDLQAAEAYVNSEYAVALTELEV